MSHCNIYIYTRPCVGIKCKRLRKRPTCKSIRQGPEECLVKGGIEKGVVNRLKGGKGHQTVYAHTTIKWSKKGEKNEELKGCPQKWKSQQLGGHFIGVTRGRNHFTLSRPDLYIHIYGFYSIRGSSPRAGTMAGNSREKEEKKEKKREN